MNIVMDTNVLVSAVLWKGLPHDALRITLASHTLVQSPETVEELENVITRKKFSSILSRNGLVAKDIVEALLAQCELYVVSAEMRKKAKTVAIDDSDDLVFITLALEAKAGFIVTGDDHLLRIGKAFGINILTVTDFIAACRKL